MSYKRALKIPAHSFFLFGPRGTGKSTWLRDQFKPDLTIDLLKTETFLEMSTSPEKLRAYVEALPKNSRVVIDEIQRIPSLLNEVHSLIFDFEDQYQFALTGSSARKLKKENVNLLAGRALTRQFFPLSSHELGDDFSVEDVLQFGSLPRAVNLKKNEDKIEYLMSYVETYLREEIQQEAVVRNLQAYNRFLKHAAIMNGQVINLSNISREAAIPRATLDGYFSILKDTLLGDFVESIHLKAKVKEVSTPKFYFFDCGVVRALRQELRQPLGPEKGFLLENLVLNELKTFSSYHALGWEIYYWGVPSGNEVDFIINLGKKNIGIEIKAAKVWRKEYSQGLNLLFKEKKIHRAIGIYQGKEKLKQDGIEIFPVEKFLKALWNGQIEV
jgi:predicted AAA+ superfamily ATPase